jgi:carboxylesterase type B
VDGETPDYDGGKLAAMGRTVVVTLAYRLNLMGFLAHPALDNEGHAFGNYGILDQQSVLRWVERDIAKFGGDKDNVTVGGQSLGAVDTGIHMLSPLSSACSTGASARASARPSRCLRRRRPKPPASRSQRLPAAARVLVRRSRHACAICPQPRSKSLQAPPAP